MAGRSISVRLDEQLASQIDAYAAANDLTKSQAVRELLRQVVTDADEVTRGWLEGRQEGLAQVLSAVQDALERLRD